MDKRQFWRWFDIVRPAIKRYDFILLRCIRRRLGLGLVVVVVVAA